MANDNQFWQIGREAVMSVALKIKETTAKTGDPSTVAVSASIREVLDEYTRTMAAVSQKLDEAAEEKKTWNKDKDTLLEQCAWLSGENGRLIDHNVQLIQEKDSLLQENSGLLKVNVELRAEAASSGKERELLQELQKKYDELREEKETAERNLNLLEERVGTGEELQKQVELLAGEIRDLDSQKISLAEEVAILAADKFQLEQKVSVGDLNKWIKIAVNLAVIVNANGSMKNGKKLAEQIIAKMPDVALYDISDLYEYTGNGAK